LSDGVHAADGLYRAGKGRDHRTEYPWKDAGATAWLATLDVSGNDVRARVTGALASTINWVCKLSILIEE